MAMALRPVVVAGQAWPTTAADANGIGGWPDALPARPHRDRPNALRGHGPVAAPAQARAGPGEAQDGEAPRRRLGRRLDVGPERIVDVPERRLARIGRGHEEAEASRVAEQRVVGLVDQAAP